MYSQLDYNPTYDALFELSMIAGQTNIHVPNMNMLSWAAKAALMIKRNKKLEINMSNDNAQQRSCERNKDRGDMNDHC